MENNKIYIDKVGREINIVKEEFDEIIALHKEEKVGHLSVEVQCFDNEWSEVLENAHPEYICVDKKYRRAGIATEMIKFATEFYKNLSFVPDSGTGAKGGGIYYDADGLALKDACEKAGITKCVDDEEW